MGDIGPVGLLTHCKSSELDRNNTTVPRDVAGARGEVRCWLFAIFTLSSATAIWCHLVIALNELRQLRRLLDEWLYSVSWRASVDCRVSVDDDAPAITSLCFDERTADRPVNQRRWRDVITATTCYVVAKTIWHFFYHFNTYWPDPRYSY